MKKNILTYNEKTIHKKMIKDEKDFNKKIIYISFIAISIILIFSISIKLF